MDPVVQGAIITVAGTLALAVVGGFIKIIWGSISDRKFFNEIKDKIGNTEGFPLSRQHEDIKETIEGRTDVIKETIKERTSNIEKAQDSILIKVYNIDQEMAANKERYGTLNLDQREIRNSVNKLVIEWEHAIAENKELRSRIMELEKQIEKMGKQYDELEIKNKELEKQNKDMSLRHRKVRGMDKEIDM